MKQNFWLPWFLGLTAFTWGAPGFAQSSPETAPTAPVSTRANDLQIIPRVGVGYSSSGGGYDGFGSFQGFIPLQQTPGKNLLYLVGQFLLDNDANPGGNLLLGYRVYNPNTDRILGGYLAYDNRDTGNGVFSQLGFGLETLGEGWDARLNTYLPVGQTRRTLSDTTLTTGFQPSSFRFQNNFLLASGISQQTRIRDREAAMAGFDAEVGGRLLRFSQTGELRGYAGLYYISAGDSAFGVRGRLELRPIDYLTAGVALTHDGIFGTSLVASIGFSFPNFRPRGVAPATVLARMGEFPGRQNAILVDHQRETIVASNILTDSPVQNPATGQPYVFQHVRPGSGGGNGSFETPFSEVTTAVAVTKSDGNAIVYVQAGVPALQGFTIPDRVQVLSSAPVQWINAALQGRAIPSLQLPLSGTGTLPQVNGSVTMGSDTVLSGFNITSSNGAGVLFRDVTSVVIQDNLMQNTAAAGISGNAAAVVTLLRNQIVAAQDQGIYLQDIGIANVSDNRVSNTRAGNTTISNPITSDLTIGSMTIANPGSIIPLPSGQGIVIASATSTVTLARNTIAGTGTQGIVLLNATGNAAITDNTITNTIGNDFPVTVPTLGSFQVPTGQGIVVAGVRGNLDISRNQVNAVRGQGIAVAGTTGGATTVVGNSLVNTLDQGLLLAGTTGMTNVINNQISDVAPRTMTATVPVLGSVTFSTGQGVTLLNTTGTVNLTGNRIERISGIFLPTFPGGQGVQIASFSGQLDLNLSNNQIRNNANDGILIGLAGRPGSITTAATANITIANNEIENNGGASPVRGDGIAIGLEEDAIVNSLLIENNTVRNNGDEGIDIRLGLQAVSGLNPTTARLTGIIRNNTITNNGQNGLQLQANGSTTARVAIISNNSSNNGERGIWLTTTNGLAIGNPTIAANIQLNTLTANTLQGISVTTTSQPFSQSICVNLTGNSSTTASTITNAPNAPSNSLQVVNLANVSTNNTGVITVTGTPTPVSTTTCP